MKQILEKYLAITLVLVLMTGCGSAADKEIMTAKEFQKKMEGMGLTVEGCETSSAKDSTYQKIYVAVDEEKYSFEYYFMKGEDSADVVYQYAVSNLSNTYDGVDDATILEDENNSVADYSVSASDYYCEVLKKENTVLYVTAYHDYELEAKKIIDELGY